MGRSGSDSNSLVRVTHSAWPLTGDAGRAEAARAPILVKMGDLARLSGETGQRISRLICATWQILKQLVPNANQFDAERFERFALQLGRAR